MVGEESIELYVRVVYVWGVLVVGMSIAIIGMNLK